ncbi:hypothetical protein RKD23_007992 [Streptomyces sp. SAI-170]|uniref:hypothetical protein n=1 Tax=Streptomyces sp. SAI-170 TaxID=3377729 RepID=UPI003C7C2F83
MDHHAGHADEISVLAAGAEVVLVDRASYDAIAYWRAALELRAEQAPRLEQE